MPAAAAPAVRAEKMTAAAPAKAGGGGAASASASQATDAVRPPSPELHGIP